MEGSLSQIPDGMKRCSKCKELLPATLEWFQSNRGHKDGFTSQCKQCINSKRREDYVDPEIRARVLAQGSLYREKNRVQIRERGKQYRERDGGEPYRRQRRQYHKDNPDKVKKWNKTRYRKNKQVIDERGKVWRKTPAGRAYSRAYVQKRRAILRMIEGHYTASDIKQQYANQKGRCYYCHCKVGEKYEVDHIIPLSRGGTNYPSNIVIACRPCNRKKNDKMPHEWEGGGGRLL